MIVLSTVCNTCNENGNYWDLEIKRKVFFKKMV